MSDNEFVKNLLVEQRKRVVGSIMGFIERDLNDRLTPMQRKELRDKVLSSVGAYHDVCLDVLKASVNDGFIPNAEVVEAIEAIHRDVKSLKNG